MKKIVVLTGAGISAESGLAVFRGSGGLWEGYEIMDVASIDGWYKNPSLVLEFYQKRRLQALATVPNEGHQVLARLQNFFDVTIVTQNVDDLHERAGSEKVIHLHGELNKSRSTANPRLKYTIPDGKLGMGDLCELGSQLRPDIVWFGEAVPLMDVAVKEAQQADIFIIVGTSLQVYPAAGLVEFVNKYVPVYIIDPEMPSIQMKDNRHMIRDTGSNGLKTLYQKLTAAL
jgi:NAD-dependent deacetylase